MRVRLLAMCVICGCGGGACSAAVGDTVDGMLIPVPDFSTADPYRVFGAGVPLF